jgi:colicin import membrane protein
MPNAPCKVHIVQLPGGDVMSATVDPSCPYDDAGRRSVENAILRTRTLPYKGFESVFQRNLTITFMPQ